MNASTLTLKAFHDFSQPLNAGVSVDFNLGPGEACVITVEALEAGDLREGVADAIVEETGLNNDSGSN